MLQAICRHGLLQQALLLLPLLLMLASALTLMPVLTTRLQKNPLSTRVSGFMAQTSVFGCYMLTEPPCCCQQHQCIPKTEVQPASPTAAV
jgi:hypothetical protein